jgi:hypothetical protein
MCSDIRYVALFLKEVSCAPLRKSLLWLPLALACSISEYFRLVFPMRSSVSRIIDSAFDEVLKYLDLRRHKTLKDFVTNTKGILYAKDLTAEESTSVMERAAFILTTDEKTEEVALEKRLPHVFISRCYERELNIRGRYLEDDYYEQLKIHLLRYVEIGAQIGCLAQGTSGKSLMEFAAIQEAFEGLIIAGDLSSLPMQ